MWVLLLPVHGVSAVMPQRMALPHAHTRPAVLQQMRCISPTLLFVLEVAQWVCRSLCGALQPQVFFCADQLLVMCHCWFVSQTGTAAVGALPPASHPQPVCLMSRVVVTFLRCGNVHSAAVLRSALAAWGTYLCRHLMHGMQRLIV